MAKGDSLEDILEGVLHLHSETGTEGGYWAFQDSRFIEQNTTRHACKGCGLYWDKSMSSSMPENPDYERPEGWPEFCVPEEHEFELVSKESWSYEGLKYLNDGDKLTIYHPDTGDEVWSGVIDLEQHDLFTEDARGYWIHADQKGIDRDEWAEYFFEKYPAKLEPLKKI